MEKYFNVAGPCHPDKHYMLSAQARCGGVLDLIAQEQYFVIHAARQSGKTTLLLELERELNAAGEYYALYCSLEVAQSIQEPVEGIPAIVRKLRQQVQFYPMLQHALSLEVDYTDYTTVLQTELALLCGRLDKPLVILFDEIDCLSNGTLISFLRQLRDGYINRMRMPFPASVGLVGLRNIRDYKAQVREDRETLGSASPFNIVTEALTLRNFTREEIGRLYGQHTARTGQVFPAEVVGAVYEATRGQPWLVNAVARDIVVKQLGRDVRRAIRREHVARAVEALIRQRPTHLDSLMERLREPRVQRIVEPVIMGKVQSFDLLDDDYQYVLDLGLLREVDARLMPANPIYGEVMVRTLTARAQKELAQQAFPEAPAYVAEGCLDMGRLLGDFQAFWRQNSEMWIERFQYKEAAPHLVLQAFLQRVINSGGYITRELATGNGRLDLCVHYEDGAYPLEVKVRYGPRSYEEGAEQLAGYMARLGCTEGWLVVFDRRPEVAWDTKVFWETRVVEGKTVHVVGC
jgi:hypothetical protein